MNQIKFFAVLIVMTYATSIRGQMKEGSLWIGGTIEYGSVFNKIKGEVEPQSKSKDISIQPFFGKSINDNSIAGIVLNYGKSYDKITSLPGTINDLYQYGGGLFYRRYKSLGKGFYIFLNGELNYSYTKKDFMKINDPSDFTESKINAFNLIAYPGISYALNRKIHLEMRTDDILRVSMVDERKHIEFPINNIRDEHLRIVNVSSSLNQIFNYLGIGFRILLNGKNDETIKQQN